MSTGSESHVLEKPCPSSMEIISKPNFSNLHPVFHVSQLRKYVYDPTHVLELDKVQIRDNLTYDVAPIRISDRKTKQLRGKTLPLVKVMWSTKDGDATWELESKMCESHPHVFEGNSNFEDKIF